MQSVTKSIQDNKIATLAYDSGEHVACLCNPGIYCDGTGVVDS